ncbi:MAG: fumarylacetoacetate hydrolase family protein, partial [Calditrichota bacterium]
MPTIEFISGKKISVGDVYCIGRNYAAHAKELNNPVPKEPMVFLKPTSSLVSEGEEIVLPEQSSDVHYEVEVCIVLGKVKPNMSPAEAEAAIDGYAVGVDITARDIQQKVKQKGHPWSVAKGFATFAPISLFVDTDAVADHANLSLELKLNGKLQQHGNTRDMIFS